MAGQIRARAATAKLAPPPHVPIVPERNVSDKLIRRPASDHLRSVTSSRCPARSSSGLMISGETSTGMSTLESLQ